MEDQITWHDLDSSFGRMCQELSQATEGKTSKFGVPFHSKQDSSKIKKLQAKGFLWEVEPIDILAKKNVAKRAETELGASLGVVGIRRAEGGVRSLSLQSCFSEGTDRRIAQFRPIFYFSDADKQEYKEFCGVTYSDCYEVWGFKRTGCACCPFGSKFEDELEVVKQYESKLYKAACKIFGPSYEYTRKYRKFKEAYKREKRRGGQIDMFDDPYAKEVDSDASDD